MPSIQYKMVCGLFKILGVNKMLEVMIAYLEDFKAACQKYKLPLTVHIGQGMMHCWGAMEFVPEAKAVRQEYFAALR